MRRMLVMGLAIWSALALVVALLLVVVSLARHQVTLLPLLYYPTLLLVVGLPVWLNRDRLAEQLPRWQLPRFPRFLLLGYGMVLIEEVFAALFNHLTEGFAFPLYLQRIAQFWALNIFAFTGLIVGWYILLRFTRFTPTEVFLLAGLFGLYAEKTLTFISNPVLFFILAPLNITVYGLIMTPATLSMGQSLPDRSLPRLLRYPLALVIPFLCSLIPVFILTVLREQYPALFPPRRFVS